MHLAILQTLEFYIRQRHLELPSWEQFTTSHFTIHGMRNRPHPPDTSKTTPCVCGRCSILSRLHVNAVRADSATPYRSSSVTSTCRSAEPRSATSSLLVRVFMICAINLCKNQCILFAFIPYLQQIWTLNYELPKVVQQHTVAIFISFLAVGEF